MQRLGPVTAQSRINVRGFASRSLMKLFMTRNSAKQINPILQSMQFEDLFERGRASSILV